MPHAFLPPSAKLWQQYYAAQASQYGHGLGGFKGLAYQRGGEIAGYRGSPYQQGNGLGSLFSGLLRSILPAAKSIGKTVGKQALRTGVQVASDTMAGRDFAESLEEHGKTGAKQLLQKGLSKLGGNKTAVKKKKKKKRSSRQKGSGLGIRKAAGTATGIKGTKSKKKVTRRKKLREDQLGLYLP